MNRLFKLLVTLTMLTVLTSCAKTATVQLNVSAKRAFDAWMSTHDLGQTVKTGHGVYITKDVPGQGDTVATYGKYIFVQFRYSSLEDSTIINYTDEDMARQLGKYKQSTYYGTEIFQYVNGVIPIGLQDMITGSASGDPSTPWFETMRTGGYRECIIPGWLSSTENYYSTEQEYINNVSGTNVYYELSFIGQVDSIEVWQREAIKSYMKKTDKVVSDTTSTGVWYYRDKDREKARGVTVREDYKFPSDTTIYINYIGRLLNGNVFDTNIEDSAKLHGIYSASTTYEPVSVTWSSDSTALKMNESSIINGFGFTLWQMHPFESGRGIFPARLGYGSDGNRPSIPGYAPLVFDIDIVEAPE